MRASIRGSIRSVMVTDSEASELSDRAASISRRSGRFSSQKSDSAASLSNSGTSSQLAKVRIFFRFVLLLVLVFLSSITRTRTRRILSRQRLIQLPLVKKSLFRLERPGVQHADGFSVRAIDAENSQAARRHAEVEETCLNTKPRRVGQQLDRKWVFKRLFNFPLIQRTTQLKRRIVPIKFHSGLLNTSMQCDYIVFTLRQHNCQWFFMISGRNRAIITLCRRRLNHCHRCC